MSFPLKEAGCEKFLFLTSSGYSPQLTITVEVRCAYDEIGGGYHEYTFQCVYGDGHLCGIGYAGKCFWRRLSCEPFIKGESVDCSNPK